MLFAIFFFYLCYSLSKSYDFFPSTINRCQSIPSNFTLCYGLGYTQMYLPNLLNHETPVCLQQTSEKPTLVSFDNDQDSTYSMTYENKKFLYPCRTLC
ncbi:unnamed protein product, partial [Rotaria sp. Silwood2]